jgi:GNAT superfamily N-acetyltransferase
MNNLNEFTYQSNPTEDEIEFIKNGLEEYNNNIVGSDNHKLLNIILKNKDKKIIGGILGGTYWGWLNIERFWIEEEYRNKGIGKKLLKKIEEEAKKRGCKHVHLDTHDFQAREFYQKQGYTIRCELKDLPKGHSKYLMTKELL